MHHEEIAMTRWRAMAVGTCVATALAFAPVTPAIAGGYYHGGHGGYHWGYHGGYGPGYGAWPHGLPAAVVRTAADILAPPVAPVARAANAPVYRPAAAYSPPPAPA